MAEKPDSLIDRDGVVGGEAASKPSPRPKRLPSQGLIVRATHELPGFEAKAGLSQLLPCDTIDDAVTPSTRHLIRCDGGGWPSWP